MESHCMCQIGRMGDIVSWCTQIAIAISTFAGRQKGLRDNPHTNINPKSRPKHGLHPTLNKRCSPGLRWEWNQDYKRIKGRWLSSSNTGKLQEISYETSTRLLSRWRPAKAVTSVMLLPWKKCPLLTWDISMQLSLKCVFEENDMSCIGCGYFSMMWIAHCLKASMILRKPLLSALNIPTVQEALMSMSKNVKAFSPHVVEKQVVKTYTGTKFVTS